MSLATINPATGEVLQTFAAFDDAEVEERLDRAEAAFHAYRRTTFEQRARWMISAAELLEGEVPDIAEMVTTEMGKTFAAAKGEVSKCARTMRWFAENASELLADEHVSTSATASWVRYEPLGPILAVMPWNFPLWQVVRFAAPGLMAGNVGLLKHASNVSRTALFLESLFARAGFPPGAFQTLLVGSERVSGIVEDERIRAVTLTGSEAAGASVAAAAGRSLKKAVLELGGSDAFVVLPTANLERAVETGAQARIQNNGQSCIAAKRFVVHREVYDYFAEELARVMSELTVGDPMDVATEVGPLSSERQLDEIASQVEDARSKGASVLCGGQSGDGPGYFYRPTVIEGVEPAMRIATEEVFGPVAVLYKADDAEDALHIANDTPFGLGASVWTEDVAEQERFSAGLEVGVVSFNAMVASNQELPFGGVKRSGFGRELGAQGIRELCSAKTVWRA